MHKMNKIGFLSSFMLIAGCGSLLPPELPENQPINKAIWLDQSWSDAERIWFHHAPQGTTTLPIPYDWLVALEQPSLSLGEKPLLIESEYMRRFGFIPSPKSLSSGQSKVYGYQGKDVRPYVPTSTRVYSNYQENYKHNENPDGLPVGFAKLSGANDPVIGEPLPDLVGFTCAACHTGQLEYKGTSVRIDGAPAMTDLDKFTGALGLSLLYTEFFPSRFKRFAKRVLGEDYTKQQKSELKSALGAKLKELAKVEKMTKEAFKEDTTGGYARLDALNRIGNQVFFTDMLQADEEMAKSNIHARNAPVNYPQIWDTSWFDWVQYDASIMQPMVRNAGEALGVAALTDVTKHAGGNLYRSTVDFDELYDMEELLAGSNPLKQKRFNGLLAPKWPDEVLGSRDPAKVLAGQALYQENCQGCHFPPTSFDAFWTDRYWTKITENEADERFLKVKQVKLSFIGTDPNQAKVLGERTVQVPEHLGIDPSTVWCGDPSKGPKPGVVTEVAFGFALGVFVEKTVQKGYLDYGITDPVIQHRMNGQRPNCIKADQVYKARPLNGVWATAPFLHNGSVPNLYQLLSPLEERSETFYVGNREFDPVNVGYETGKLKGTFLFDTHVSGNSNKGHEFKNGKRGNGVIGRYLTPEERYQLIEYLKSI